MNAAFHKGYKPSNLYSEELLIFTAFSAGLFFVYKFEPHLFSPELFSAFGFALLILAFIAGSSILGPLLLPLLAFLFGAHSYKLSEQVINIYITEGRGAIGLIMFALISYPAFFVICARGMECSGILIKTLCSSGLTVKQRFNDKYYPILFGLLLSALTVYLSIG